MSDKQGLDTGTYWVIVLGLVFGVLFFFYRNFYMVAGVWKYIRLVEMAPFYFVPSWVPYYGDLDVKGAIQWLWRIEPQLIAPGTISEFDKIYPRWFAWIPGMVVVAIGIRKQRRAERVNDRFDEEQLLRRLAPVYPFLKRYVDVNPNNKPTVFKRGSKDAYIHSGAMSESLWATLSPPRLLEDDAKTDSSIDSAIWDGDIGFDMNLAERAFEAQLTNEGGGAWKGVSSLAPLQRKVFDCLEMCMPFSEDEDLDVLAGYLRDILDHEGGHPNKDLPYGDRDVYSVCRTYLVKLADKDKGISSTQAKPNWSAMKKAYYETVGEYDFLIRFYQSKAVKVALKKRRARAVMDNHAFVYTGFISLLTEARRTGIIAVAEYLHFVKGRNRTLLYTLQSAGKRVAFIEAAGVVAHWRVECEMAVAALHKGLKLEERTALKTNKQKKSGKTAKRRH